MKTNDRLAQGLLFGIIPALWILTGRGILNLPGEIIGATIAGWTLLIQYYFRKKPKENE